METVQFRLEENQTPNLTDWKNEPTLQLLKKDLQAAKAPHDIQIGKIKRWSELLRVEGAAKPKKIKGRSSVQPKLIRRQAEWRYSALTEPFLSTEKPFKVSPITFEDYDAAKQNQLVLNYQFRTKINRIKFVDDYVRSVVDEGTAIVRVGWKRATVTVQEDAPVYQYRAPMTEEELAPLQQALELKNSDPRTYDEQVNPLLKAAVEYFEETNQPSVAEQVGVEKVPVEKVLINQPTAVILNPENVFVDPACEGDLDKALFVVVSFETNKAELVKEGRYKNLDRVNFSGNTPLSEPDHATNTPEEQAHGQSRTKVVAYEYWGFYDIGGNDVLVPIVVTWIGDTIIRMERNPFPDQKLPFVVVPYLPVKRELFGEPDAELLEDNQNILGAVTRGMIDIMGRSANGQQGFAKGMLDPLNRKRFDNGQDYEFNPNVSPANGHINHTYPEIPQSAMLMLNLQNQEAEALTGVKSFGGGISGEAYGDVAAGIRGALDAASKREMAILRRLAKGMKDIGQKFISMNAVFLSEKETVRITNTEFIQIKREDLQGEFDLDVDISTAEIDNAKAQDLGFMLQTIGPNMDFSMTQLILAEIADLKRMPALAQKIRQFQPQPDPLAEELKRLQVEELRYKVAELQSKAALNNAKAEEASAGADKETLDFVRTEQGIKHAEDLEKQRAQAEGNQNLQVTKALTTPTKEGERKPDIEAAVGFNELSNGRRSIGDNPPPVIIEQPTPQFDPLEMQPEVAPILE